MNDQVYVVIVDTRGMMPYDIDGYEEHTCSPSFFDDHVVRKSRVKCIKSKVAEMCGLDMKVYFHDYMNSQPRTLQDPPEIAITTEQRDLWPKNVINGGATLLTFDPRTGFPEYNIIGKAYVVVDSGDYPLSSHQVWGIQDLISEARDLYYCDPDHLYRGRRQLLRWCISYRNQEWGPLTIYEPRVIVETNVKKTVTFKDIDQETRAHIREVHDYYSHRHFPNCGCRRCERSRNPNRLQIRGSASSSSSATSTVEPSSLSVRQGSFDDRTWKQGRSKSRRWTLFPRGLTMCNNE